MLIQLSYVGPGAAQVLRRSPMRTASSRATFNSRAGGPVLGVTSVILILAANKVATSSARRLYRK